MKNIQIREQIREKILKAIDLAAHTRAYPVSEVSEIMDIVDLALKQQIDLAYKKGYIDAAIQAERAKLEKLKNE